MKELIERLEKTTRPDPELGRDVLLACGWHKTCTGYFYGQMFHWSSPDGAISFDDDHFHRHDPTERVDTALALVPRDHVVASLRNGDLDRKYFDVRRHTRWTVMLAPDGRRLENPYDISQFPQAVAESPAVALCIAALKARAS